MFNRGAHFYPDSVYLHGSCGREKKGADVLLDPEAPPTVSVWHEQLRITYYIRLRWARREILALGATSSPDVF